MRIAIGLNIFGQYTRQDVCLHSLLRLQEKGKSMDVEIDLFNITFPEETSHRDGISDLRFLKRSNQQYTDSKRKLPIVNEFFDVLAELEGYDYICFTNSDIVFTNNFLERCKTLTGECVCVSRLEVEPMESIYDRVWVSTQAPKYEVAGFDVYMCTPSWWKENKHHLPDYILAKPRWDNHFTAVFCLHGKAQLWNANPPAIVHTFHGYGSHVEDGDYQHNHSKNWYGDAARFDRAAWGAYFDYVLAHRPTGNGIFYSQKFDNEDEVTRMIYEKGLELKTTHPELTEEQAKMEIWKHINPQKQPA